MPVLETVTALLTAGAPPAAVPDARAAVAVYCVQTCELESLAALESALSAHFELRDALPRSAGGPEVVLSLLQSSDFGLPGAEYLSDYGVGLSAADAEALTHSSEVVLLELAAPSAGAITAQAAMNEAALAFAEAEAGWLEDLETREVFSREQWRARRVDSLRGEPAFWDLIRIESYPVGEDGLERMVTYGLDKFGLHEVAVTDVHPAFADDMAATLLLLAAQGIEGRPFTEHYTLDLASLKSAGARALLAGSLWTADRPGVISAGEGRAELRLVSTRPEEGDNPGPMVQLVPAGTGTPAENLGALLDTLWGYGGAPEAAASPAGATGEQAVDIEAPDDAVVFIVVPDDSSGEDALAAASAAARAVLNSEIKRRWDAGLEPGSALAVKAPFRAADGALEWMWVAVARWSGQTMSGELLNQPRNIPGLSRGDTVTVNSGEAFDYLLRHADGTREGGSTEALLPR